MSHFQKSESLVAVYVLFQEKLYRAVQGSGTELGILYLGSKDAGPPVNANSVLMALRDEVLAEPQEGAFSVAGALPPSDLPWSVTIHHSEGGDTNLWIARDFRDTGLTGAGEADQAWLLFAPNSPDDIESPEDLLDIAIAPTRARLYAAVDAPGLGSAARDYGAARDLDD